MRIAAVVAVVAATVLLWLCGWWLVLLLSLWFGPQAPFDRAADIWLVLGSVGMTGAALAAGLGMMRTALRRMV